MKYCKECGRQVKESAAFCTYCGTKFNNASKQPKQQQETQTSGHEGGQSQKLHLKESRAKSESDAKSKSESISKTGTKSRAKSGSKQTPKRPISKKTKIIISAAGALVLLLIGGYFAGNSVYSKERTAEQFKEAVTEEDTEALGRLLYSDDSNLKIDDAKIDSFLDYLQENPSYRGDLIQSVSHQATSEESDGNVGLAEDEQTNLRLTSNGKKWLVFDNYELEVQPIYFTLATDYENTELYVDDEKIATADSDDFSKEAGPFITGIYSAEAKLANDYVDLESERTIELDDNTTKDDVVHIEMDAGYVAIESEEEMEGSILLNEQETDVQLGDNASIGPVPLDSSINMQIKHDFPWGEETSEEIPIENTSVYIDEYPVSDDLEDDLMEAGNQYLKDDAKAFEDLDADKFSNVSDALHSEVSDEIDMLKDREDKREIKLEKIVYDIGSFGINVNDDTYYAKAIAEITSQEDTYDTDDEPDLKDNEGLYGISFYYDEDDDQWMVDDIYKSYETLSDQTEDFVMDGDNEATKEANSEEASDDEESENDSEADDLDELIDGYETEMFVAVNNDDFGLVEPYLYEGSDLYESQEELVDHLNENGTKEELLDYEIKDTECDEDEATCQIDVDETAEIIYESGDSEEINYSWTYTAKETDDGSFKLSNIEER